MQKEDAHIISIFDGWKYFEEDTKRGRLRAYKKNSITVTSETLHIRYSQSIDWLYPAFKKLRDMQIDWFKNKDKKDDDFDFDRIYFEHKKCIERIGERIIHSDVPEAYKEMIRSIISLGLNKK